MLSETPDFTFKRNNNHVCAKFSYMEFIWYGGMSGTFCWHQVKRSKYLERTIKIDLIIILNSTLRSNHSVIPLTWPIDT